MLKNYEIVPNLGMGEIKFGLETEPFINQFGEPEDLESIDEDEEFNTTVLHYWKNGFSVFFVGLSQQVLAGIETDHPKTTLFGKKIMGMTESEVIELMKNHGHTDYESEFEDADKRLSFDISMIDFFFRNGKLIYMNFGVLVDEKGDIETV
jgi:hypothetical protein